MIGISEGMVEKLRAARGARTVPMAEVVARLGTVVVGHRDIATAVSVLSGSDVASVRLVEVATG